MPLRDMDREQMWMLPPTLDELLPLDHPARFVAESVDALGRDGWSELGVEIGGDPLGAPAYHPRALLSVWLYGFMTGVRSCRKLEAACRDQISYLWLTGWQHPDHNTLWRFYKGHRQAMRKLFERTVRTAVTMKLVDLAVQAVDGTKVVANASVNRSYDAEGLSGLLARLERAIADLEAQNEAGEDTAAAHLPEELADKEVLREKMKQAMDDLANQERHKRINLTDREARLMKGRQGIVAGYNAQAMVSPVEMAGGGTGMLVTAVDVVDEANDNAMLAPMMERAEETTGTKSQTTLADAGYFAGSHLAECSSRGQQVVVSEARQRFLKDPYHKDRFTYDEQSDSFTCPQGQTLAFVRIQHANGVPLRLYRASGAVCQACPAFGVCTRAREIGRSLAIGPHDAVLRRHRTWMATSAAKEAYKLRKQLVEPVFGIIKEQQGARRFLLRGLVNVAAEWTVLATAFNLRTLWRSWRSRAFIQLPHGPFISIPLPDPNCAANHPSPIYRHLQLSRQESFSKSHRLKPSAPTCYPLHHFWDRLNRELFPVRERLIRIEVTTFYQMFINGGNMGLRLMSVFLGVVAFALAACGDVGPTPTATQKSPGAGSQTQQIPTPTATPSPKLPGSITPVPASERYRLDLGVGVVVAFVEGLSPKFSGKIAYVTHVPTGSQLVLDPDGEIIDRHDGRDDGPDRLDAVLADQATVDRIVEGLKGDGDLRPRQTAADWAHSIQFGGITYLAKGSLGGPIITEGERALTTEDLGSELYRVAFRIEGYSGYPYLDGDATYLNPGTPVYGVEGYVQEFRLAILEDGGVRLFESDTNPLAKTGEALLDIRGKVTSIDVLSTKNSIKVLGTKVENGEDVVLGKIEEERAIERFVEMVLDSPVDQGNRDREGPRYFLDFRQADGTSVVRAFWLESGEISRGIMTDPAATLSVWRALGEDNRPLATNGGPRTSERLAARLGLAYLSFAMPEIVVTGKPHSPVVRLMRRSEFQAMIGSARSLSSDPLVWVVEVQGSWRDAGIVPEDKRQDFSVAVVALDAETGSTYGRSYTNTPLLGTPGGSRPSTPSQTPTPEPIMPGSASKVPEHIRLDLDNGVVVAFADDPNRGRIAYVTHVESGAQVVLDREGKMLERHDSPVVDGDLLDATLKDGDSMKKIRRGLDHEGVLIRDPITTWVDGFHFGGASYGRASKRGDSVSNGERELDQSDLGLVVYRVAFCLSCNIELPMGYQAQDGDAALLQPGTAIHSVKGHDPNLKLAAVVNGKVLLYERRP